MKVLHSRVQHPVGHGFFHSSTIEFDGSRFNYVYDCGGARVRERVHEYLTVSVDKRIDALFVSHLHHDHVGGLDYLLPDVELGSVFLPYLTDDELILLAIEAVESGEADSVYLSLLRDPVAWFRDRGAKRVIEIRGGESERPVELPTPNPGDLDQDNEAVPDRLDIFPYRPDGSAWDVGEKPRWGRTHDRVLVDDVPFCLTRWQLPVWWLVPYVQKAPENRLNGFVRDVRNILGEDNFRAMLRKDKRQFFWRFCLADRDFRRSLRNAYRRSFRSINTTSLCLYSGASVNREPTVFWPRQKSTGTRAPLGGGFCSPDGRHAWLGTGDAVLGDGHAVDQMRLHLETLLGNVLTMSIPHHGSRDNAGPELLDAVGPIMGVVTCRAGDPLHPHPSLVNEIDGSGCDLVVVNVDGRSHYEELVAVGLR